MKDSRPNCAEKITENLVYIGVPYLAPVDVTERRNLVYEFKCLVSRNTDGRLVAGVYFPITPAGSDKFTVFYQDGGATKREKICFESLANVSFQEFLFVEVNLSGVWFGKQKFILFFRAKFSSIGELLNTTKIIIFLDKLLHFFLFWNL